MKDLLEALDAYLTASDIFDRQHTEQARKLKDRKRAILNHNRAKYQKAQAQAQQMTLAAPSGQAAEQSLDT
jgi:hypothetical protein